VALEFSEQLRVIRVHLRCTQKELATRIGISPGAIFKYENNQMNPTLRTIAKVEDFIKEQKLESILSLDGPTQTQNSEATLSVQQQNMLIDLQADKIKQLEEKLHKKAEYDSLYTADNDTDITFDFKIALKWSIKNPGIKVQYHEGSQGNYIEMISKKLGYTEDEIKDLLQIGQMVEYKNHKIHSLRSKEEKEEMLGIINTFMNAYQSVRLNTNLLIAEIPVKYTAKNGQTFASNVEYRVNWLKGTGTAHIRWCKD
jgi:transcriptional regulator with XRE-family HTH domain